MGTFSGDHFDRPGLGLLALNAGAISALSAFWERLPRDYHVEFTAAFVSFGAGVVLAALATCYQFVGERLARRAPLGDKPTQERWELDWDHEKRVRAYRIQERRRASSEQEVERAIFARFRQIAALLAVLLVLLGLLLWKRQEIIKLNPAFYAAGLIFFAMAFASLPFMRGSPWTRPKMRRMRALLRARRSALALSFIAIVLSFVAFVMGILLVFGAWSAGKVRNVPDGPLAPQSNNGDVIYNIGCGSPGRPCTPPVQPESGRAGGTNVDIGLYLGRRREPSVCPPSTHCPACPACPRCPPRTCPLK